MSSGTTFRRFKRRFKKKLYNFLLNLNEIDFSKFRPLCYLLLLGAILLILAKLPTTETNNAESYQISQGASLASDIRRTVASVDSIPVDVVALFFPQEASGAELYASLQSETLYSFYLTGQELSYLAEGAVTSISKGTTLYLDGLNYTYHKNRLPFNRITALSTATDSELVDNALYHVISTEDIFSLFHYISYRSIGIMSIYPKDATGALLSDYHEVLLTQTDTPLTVESANAYTANAATLANNVPSVVTMQSGFNLIDLIKEPNKITICVGALLIAFFALLWYIIPRIKRIRLWFRIYRIRSKKRSSHSIYGIRKRF